jgi:8-oxo-dGTP diphosphatase
VRVVGCFMLYQDKFVILLRHSHKPDGNTWGLPSGKVEPGESDEAAMLRELAEETGYHAQATELQHLGDYDFISSRGQAYTYVTYQLRLQKPHTIRLEDAAHSTYQWLSAEDCYAKPDLISGFHSLLKLTGKVSDKPA